MERRNSLNNFNGNSVKRLKLNNSESSNSESENTDLESSLYNEFKIKKPYINKDIWINISDIKRFYKSTKCRNVSNFVKKNIRIYHNPFKVYHINNLISDQSYLLSAIYNILKLGKF